MLKIQLAESPEEREAIQAFRYRVYVDEMGKPMAEADHVHKRVVDPADATGIIFAAYEDDELVGTLRLNVGLASMANDPHLAIYNAGLFADVDPDKLAFASRFMLRRDYRGSMAAHRLSLGALEAAMSRGVRLALCYCAPYLISYYEQMGFRRYTNNFQDELGYRIPMVMVLYDAEHLRAVKSPLLERVPPPPPGEDWHAWFLQRFPDFVIPINSRLVSTEEFYGLLNRMLHDDPLQSIPLLRNLDKEEADHVFKAGTVLPCRAGETIIRAGERSTEMYLSLSTMVGIVAPNSGRVIR
ncbi:MAG: GNAT family N-acetyltransferase, partial [Cyanobacteria bacterium REEB65]|nr:GNAT family N-acetyltransferase [Cyanobacteria bacterium REEB65]